MVPVFWDLGANVRMQKCVIAAMRAAGLGSIASSVDPSLFMVNEAEAASMNALGSGLHNFLVSSWPCPYLPSLTRVFISSPAKRSFLGTVVAVRQTGACMKSPTSSRFD